MGIDEWWLIEDYKGSYELNLKQGGAPPSSCWVYGDYSYT